MRMQLKVDIEWQDTVDGKPGEPTQCAIVAFINRVYPEYTHVRVNGTQIRMTDKAEGKRYVWATPLPARKFINDFDKGKSPQGLTFYLRREEAITSPMAAKRNPAVVRAEQQRYKARVAEATATDVAARKRVVAQRKKRERVGA